MAKPATQQPAGYRCFVPDLAEFTFKDDRHRLDQVDIRALQANSQY